MKIKHTNTADIVCPHCGHQFIPNHTFDILGTKECKRCGNGFQFKRTVLYITEKAWVDEVCTLTEEEFDKAYKEVQEWHKNNSKEKNNADTN